LTSANAAGVGCFIDAGHLFVATAVVVAAVLVNAAAVLVNLTIIILTAAVVGDLLVDMAAVTVFAIVKVGLVVVAIIIIYNSDKKFRTVKKIFIRRKIFTGFRLKEIPFSRL